jgi:hypothetical protein
MRRLLAGLALLAATSCSDSVVPGQKITDLGTARARWGARGFRDYSFTFSAACFCANVHPIRAIVVHDSVTTAVDLVTNQPVDPRFVSTIDRLFTFIEQGIAKPAAVLDVTYDAQLGYPITIRYDGSANIADDEVTYTVRDVVAYSALR